MDENATDWKVMAEKLWQLLDDIDTLDDACKSNDAAFRKQAIRVAVKRNKLMHSPDGFKLVVTEDPEAMGECPR